MKKNFTTIYAVFASAFILFTLFFLGSNLHREYKQGYSRTTSVFANTVFKLSHELGNIRGNSESFYKKVTSAMNDFQDYSFYELKKDNQVIFSYPANSSQDKTKSNFTKEFNTTIKIDDNNSYLLTCNIYLLKPYSIYHYSQIAFFMILIITVITIALLLVPAPDKEEDKKEAEKPENEIKATKEISNNTEENTVTEAEENKETAETIENDGIEDAGITDVVEENTDNNNIDNNNIENNNIEETKDEEPAVEAETTLENIPENQDIAETEVIPETENPQAGLESISEEETTPEQEKCPETEENNVMENAKETCGNTYSKATNIKLEQDFLPKLNSEIDKSIASETDIALFIIGITNIAEETDTIKQVYNCIAEQFQHEDLIFEYKDNFIAAIKNSTVLEEALIFADKLYADITGILGNKEKKCYIGISTKTVRIISGERLLLEAEEALIHAQADKDSPIIAFRADVEKYRQYLENKLDA